MAEPKDFWDKLDIVGKLLSGVILALIAIFIKTGTDDIAAAQQQGDLVRNLLVDLTSNDQRTRQDLALIALNHSVSDSLMIEIAARLVLDTTGYSAGDQALTSVAFRILLQRDPVMAESLKAQRQRGFENQVADPVVRAAARSAPDTSTRPPVSAAGDSVARNAHELIAPLSSSVVFIQFGGTFERAVAGQLRNRLAEAGFAAPAVEHIGTAFSSSVRYFHSEDSVLADSVGQVTHRLLQEKAPRVGAIPVQNLSGRGFRVPRGQIEVWLNAP